MAWTRGFDCEPSTKHSLSLSRRRLCPRKSPSGHSVPALAWELSSLSLEKHDSLKQQGETMECCPGIDKLSRQLMQRQLLKHLKRDAVQWSVDSLGEDSRGQQYQTVLGVPTPTSPTWHLSRLVTSSQSTPAIHTSCIRIFALTVNGAKNWSGSNRPAMALSTFRLVGTLLTLGGSTWKVKTSLLASHMTLRVLVLGNSSSLISRVDSRSSKTVTIGSFEDHFLNLNPARANSSDSWCRSCWALWVVSYESSSSSTYIESFIVSATSGKSKACVFAWVWRTYREQNGEGVFPNSNHVNL